MNDSKRLAEMEAERSAHTVKSENCLIDHDLPDDAPVRLACSESVTCQRCGRTLAPLVDLNPGDGWLEQRGHGGEVRPCSSERKP